MEVRDPISRVIQLEFGSGTKSWQEESRQVIVGWLRRVIMLLVAPLCKGRMLMKACCVDVDLIQRYNFDDFVCFLGSGC
jgi:hypothetical protein